MQNTDRYEFGPVLGRGAFGVVYQARDCTLGRKVAIKVVDSTRLERTGSTLAYTFLERDARALATLHHDNIVDVYDIFYRSPELTPSGLCVVMEFVDGRGLDTFLVRDTPLDIDLSVKLLWQVAAALDYVHSLGVVHRDIKPANILLERDFAIKVVDFGISRIIGQTTIVGSGDAVGTPTYMSPEQVISHEVEGSADQYSLACLAFRLLTGRTPFVQSDGSLFYHILNTPPPAATSINTALPQAVDAVLNRGLAKDPHSRFTSCKNLLEALDQALTVLPHYQAKATRDNPALIIYLLDTSRSMSHTLDNAPRIWHVTQAMKRILSTLIMRSTKGAVVSPRYRIAVCAYSDSPRDIFGKIEGIDAIAKMPDIQLIPEGTTNTASAFRWAANLLTNELKAYGQRPAPLVCHLTDGEYTEESPVSVAKEILNMRTADGHVLIENIFVGDALTDLPIVDPKSWPGVFSRDELAHDYARELFDMSAPLPDSYAHLLREMGYSLTPGSKMLFPVHNKELLRLAFAASGATNWR